MHLLITGYSAATYHRSSVPISLVRFQPRTCAVDSLLFSSPCPVRDVDAGLVDGCVHKQRVWFFILYFPRSCVFVEQSFVTVYFYSFIRHVPWFYANIIFVPYFRNAASFSHGRLFRFLVKALLINNSLPFHVIFKIFSTYKTAYFSSNLICYTQVSIGWDIFSRYHLVSCSTFYVQIEIMEALILWYQQ